MVASFRPFLGSNTYIFTKKVNLLAEKLFGANFNKKNNRFFSIMNKNAGFTAF
jgi:hypothetical protein